MRLSLNKSKARAGRPAQALLRFQRFLAQKSLRLTAARAAIVEAALERQGHFPIEDLVADLRRRGIRGSKATVYRTLPLLAEAGILQREVASRHGFRLEGHLHQLVGRCAACQAKEGRHGGAARGGGPVPGIRN